MRRLIFIMCSIMPLCLAGYTAAQSTAGNSLHYRWVDGSGLPHYSDSLTDDALKYGYDVINSAGMVQTHVQRQLTPSEQTVAKQQAAEQASRQNIIEAQKRKDIQLLNTYPDENSLKDEQQRVLENLDEQMNTTRVNLHSQDATLTDLLNRAADNERAKQPVPKPLTDQIATQRNVVADERALLQREKQNRDAMAEKLAREMQHYRELKAAEKADRGY